MGAKAFCRFFATDIVCQSSLTSCLRKCHEQPRINADDTPTTRKEDRFRGAGMKARIWRGIVRMIGGTWSLGRVNTLDVVIHDGGILVLKCSGRVIRKEWKWRVSGT